MGVPRIRFSWPMLIFTLWAGVAFWLFFAQEKPWELVELQEARLAEGKSRLWKYDAGLGLSVALFFNGVLACVLAVTSRWWAGELPGWSCWKGNAPVSGGGGQKFFWITVALAVVLGTGLRWNLSGRSLWWDELWAVAKASSGEWKEDAGSPGGYRFRSASWFRAAYYYAKPTNHATSSLLHKGVHGTWVGRSGAPEGVISERLLRSPSLVASALGIVLVACLLRMWGFSLAGAGAAFFLALHPWAVRYGAEARAYTLVVPLFLASCLFLTRLLRDPHRWWPWIGFGISLWLWLWTFPANVFLAFGLFVGAAFGLWRGLADEWRGVRWMALARVVAVSAAAGGLFLVCFLPSFVQSSHWNLTDAHGVSAKTLRSTCAWLATGMEFRWPVSEAAGGLETLETRLGFQLPFMWALLVLLNGLALVGLWRVRRYSPAGFLVVVGVLGGAVVYLVVWYLAGAPGAHYYPRFVMPLLPVFTAGLALGVEGLGCWCTHGSVRGRCAALCMGLLGFGWLSAPALEVLCLRPYAPLRDVVEWMGAQRDRDGEAPVIAGYGLGGKILKHYGKEIRWAGSLDQLEAIVSGVEEDSRALYLTVGYEGFNRVHGTDGFLLIDDPSKFEVVKTFGGIEPDFYYRVYRWKGGQD